jgi:formamidopyrimidine-DNA glycosylase
METVMPELPEMQALAERLDVALSGSTLLRADVLGFSGLKTVVPQPDAVAGRRLTGITRRGKYLVLAFAGDLRILVHLSQAGRLDLEMPPKETKPRGSVVRLTFDTVGAVLVREHGTQRKAGWWVLGPGEAGPLGVLGPEPSDPAFADLILAADNTRHVHSLLRDQRTVAGIGRGHVDDALNRAGVSPFASLRSLTTERRRALLDAVRAVLDEALESERGRSGGLSDAKLGARFQVHNRAGQPCPRCAGDLARVSYESYEIVYCPACQTGGRVLADRRLSRLLR